MYKNVNRSVEITGSKKLPTKYTVINAKCERY